MIEHINGDLLKDLEETKDESVDLVLTDPPYNISSGQKKPEWVDPITGENKNTIHNHNFSDSFDESWDEATPEEFISQIDKWVELWSRKLRKGGAFAIFFSDKYISHLWHSMEKHGLQPRRIFTWKKPAAVPFNRKVNPVSGSEFVLWGFKPKGKRTFNSDTEKFSLVDRHAIADKMSSILYKHLRDGIQIDNVEELFEIALKESKKMLETRKSTGNISHAIVANTFVFSGGKGKKIHPTQKPIEILEYFISLLTNEGDIVLDTFAGSGSTGIAARNLDRKCILIERDSKMYAKMVKNLGE
jgi:site-specific DNA-methyltransferase (adenine-specific)